MAVVERISHRVAVMHLGEIVEIGPRASVFGNPRHPYTQKLIAAVPSPRSPRGGASAADWLPMTIPSPFRAADYAPPPRAYDEVSPGHLVRTA